MDNELMKKEKIRHSCKKKYKKDQEKILSGQLPKELDLINIE